MELVNIGFENYVALDQLVAVISPDSAPVRRYVARLRENGEVVDATSGRKTRSVIITAPGRVVLSALSTETIAQRCQESHGAH